MKKLFSLFLFLLLIPSFSYAEFTLGGGYGQDSCSSGGFQYHDRTGCVTYTACNIYAGPSGLPDPHDNICKSSSFSTPSNASCSFTSEGRKCSCNSGFKESFLDGINYCIPENDSCPSGYADFYDGLTKSCKPKQAKYCSNYALASDCDVKCPADRPTMIEHEYGGHSCLSNINVNDCTYGANTTYPHHDKSTCANPPLTTCETASAALGLDLNCQKANNNGTCAGQPIGVNTEFGTICGLGAGSIGSLGSGGAPLNVTFSNGSPPSTTGNIIPDLNETPDISCFNDVCFGDDDFQQYSGPDVSESDYDYSYQDTNGNLLNCDSSWRNCYILNNDGSFTDVSIDGAGNVTTVHHTPDGVVSTVNDVQPDGIYQNTNPSNPVKPNNTTGSGSGTGGTGTGGTGTGGDGSGGDGTGGTGTGGDGSGTGTGGNGSGSGSGSGSGNGNGNGDTDGDGDTVSWSADGFPDVPDTFYESEYEDGLQGIWDNAMAALEETDLGELIEGLTPDFPTGECPAWSMDFGIGHMIDMGVIGFEDICWLWLAIKIIMIITALFTARALIFGG